MSDGELNLAYLALGSNSQAERYLPAAVVELSQHGRIVAVSKVWQNPPVDGGDQPDYLNAAILLETDLSAVDLCLEIIPAIEAKLDRVRDPNNKYAMRTIDIDIVLFNNDILQIEHRRIPDPEIESRPFLAIPLAQLNPDYMHPGTGQTLATIAQSADVSCLRLRSDVDLQAALPKQTNVWRKRQMRTHP